MEPKYVLACVIPYVSYVVSLLILIPGYLHWHMESSLMLNKDNDIWILDMDSHV